MDIRAPSFEHDVTKGIADQRYIQQSSFDLSGAPINISGYARVQLGDTYVYRTPEVDEAKEAVETLSNNTIFPEIFNRYRAIEDEHDGTCRWVLSDDGEETSRTRKWDSFTEWLRDDRQIYWICGKPGSGKSTLMKYLFVNLSDSNAFPKQLVISHWFWEAGTRLERGLEGCLRSLLWQCLQSSMGPKIIAKCLAALSSSLSWTSRGLVNALRDSILSIQNEGVRIVLLLDGIDECGYDAEIILETVDKLVGEVSGLKVCVSSRPEQLFVETLSDHPKLRLQDLNSEDIMKVIADDFLTKPVVARLLKHKPEDREYFKETLESRAQGVFLWVRLAIRNLLRGITNRDQSEVLKSRLESLPDSLDKLYAVMLSRNEFTLDSYEDTAAFYFNLILHRRMSMIEFCLSIDQQQRKALLDPKGWTINNVKSAVPWEDARVWVNTRSGGLLEVRVEDWGFPNISYTGHLEFLNLQSDTYVDFIHRTVRTYLLSTYAGKNLMSKCTFGGSDTNHICFETMLIVRYIIPCINGRCLGIKDIDWSFPRCESCDSPDQVCFDYAKKVWNFLNEQNSLKTSYLWLPEHLWLPGHLSGRIGSLFASFENGSIDYARTCSRLGWYQYVQQEIEQAGSVMNKLYATTVLTETIVSASWMCTNPAAFRSLHRDVEVYWNRKRERLFMLLPYLKALGANLSVPLMSPCGEQTTCLTILLTYLHGCQIMPELHNFMSSITGTAEHRFVSTITDIALQNGTSHDSDPHFLWGSFSVADVCNLTNTTGFSYVKTSKPSRIYVISVIERDSTTESTYPEKHGPCAYYGLTKSASDELLTYFRSLYNTKENIGIGVTAVYGSVLCIYGNAFRGDISSDLVYLTHLIRTICNRSKRLQSLPEALLYMGKSQEAIDRFIYVQETELRRLREPEEKIVRLKARFTIGM